MRWRTSRTRRLLLAPLAIVALFATACSGPELTSKWRSYGNDNTRLDDWTGGDGAASVRLPDGRTLWFMNDAFLGPVNADGSRPGGVDHAHNTAIVESAPTQGFGPTLVGPPPPPGETLRDSFLESPSPDTFYWILDGVVEGNLLRLLVSESTPSDPYRQLIVTLSLPDLTVVGSPVLLPYYATAGVNTFLETPTYTYMYGTRHFERPPGPAVGETYVARVQTGNVSQTSTWQYLTEAGWRTDPTTSPLEVISDVWGGTVVQVGGEYVLAGFSTPLRGDVVTARAPTPFGPFSTPTLAYEVPENGDPCGTGWQYSYALMPHQEHGTWPEAAVFSYSVNCWGDLSALLTDVENYRPRYIDLDLTG